MRGEPSDRGGATEGDYARAARDALARGELGLALEQLGAALTFAPLSPEHLELLEVVLARTPKPLVLLPDRGEAFFGTVAVRAHALMRERRLGAAVLVLLDVVTFRPTIPYLLWLDDWTKRGVRGISLDGVTERLTRFARSLDTHALSTNTLASRGARANVEAASRLLDELASARPRAKSGIAELQFDLLKRIDDLGSVRAIAESALAIDDPVADVVRRVVSRSALEDARGPVRVRVRVDAPPSPSANIALAAALAELGRAGALYAVLPDGQTVEAPPSPSPPSSPALLERVRELSRADLDLDAWIAPPAFEGPGSPAPESAPSADDIAPILDALAESDGSGDPVRRLQRMRLAALSLVARGADPERIDGLCGLARGHDGWLAAASIAVLSAVSRRGGAIASQVDRALAAVADTAPTDARRDPLSRTLLLTPSADERTRGIAKRMRRELVAPSSAASSRGRGTDDV